MDYGKKTILRDFFLRRARISKAGLAPILARITTNGVSKEVYIQCSVPADRWSQAKEWATGRDKLCQQVNAYLNEYRARILAIRQELIAKGYEGKCIEIKNQLQNPESFSKQFLTEFGQYCEKRQGEVGVRITQLTANKYHHRLPLICLIIAGKSRTSPFSNVILLPTELKHSFNALCGGRVRDIYPGLCR